MSLPDWHYPALLVSVAGLLVRLWPKRSQSPPNAYIKSDFKLTGPFNLSLSKKTEIQPVESRKELDTKKPAA